MHLKNSCSQRTKETYFLGVWSLNRNHSMCAHRPSILSLPYRKTRSKVEALSFTLQVSTDHKTDTKIHLTTIGIMYAFLGISLATQDYINPSIDIIKKKGVVSKLMEFVDTCVILLALIGVHECNTSRHD